MADRPHTPVCIAVALEEIAARLYTAELPDADLGPVRVTVNLQPDYGRADAVDVLSVALTGQRGETEQLPGGVAWHHCTPLNLRQVAPGVDVAAYTPVEDPTIAAARQERDALAAELAELRAEWDAALNPPVLPCPVARPAICRHSSYIGPGGADRGDRIVRCALPSGHPGDHREADTEVTWT